MGRESIIDEPTVTIPSRLFGPVMVAESQIIHFPEGLKGFASQHRFVLLPTETEGLFWLQSADEGNLTFLVIDPFAFIIDYEIPIPPEGIGGFTYDEHDDLIVLTIVTLPASTDLHPTVNLAAPLVVNPARQTGYQILNDPGLHSSRHALTLPVSA